MIFSKLGYKCSHLSPKNRCKVFVGHFKSAFHTLWICSLGSAAFNMIFDKRNEGLFYGNSLLGKVPGTDVHVLYFFEETSAYII